MQWQTCQLRMKHWWTRCSFGSTRRRQTIIESVAWGAIFGTSPCLRPVSGGKVWDWTPINIQPASTWHASWIEYIEGKPDYYWTIKIESINHRKSKIMSADWNRKRISHKPKSFHMIDDDISCGFYFSTVSWWFAMVSGRFWRGFCSCGLVQLLLW